MKRLYSLLTFLCLATVAFGQNTVEAGATVPKSQQAYIKNKLDTINRRVYMYWGDGADRMVRFPEMIRSLDLKADQSALDAHTSNTSNPHSVTKSQLGLGNVDNTSDLNKPISTATQTALNAKLDTSAKGVAGGIPYLDGSVKIPLIFINDALIGSVNYKGAYNVATNTPALPAASSDNKGWYYVVNDEKTVFAGDSVFNGDWVISNGSVWEPLNQNRPEIDPVWTAQKSLYVPYTGATTGLNLGTKTLTAGLSTFNGSGTDYSVTGNSTAGYQLQLTYSSDTTRRAKFQVNNNGDLSISTSNNRPITINNGSTGKVAIGYSTLIEKLNVNGYTLASGYKIPSGTSSQALMADGSTATLGSNAYTSTAYLPLTAGSGSPLTGELNIRRSAGNTHISLTDITNSKTGYLNYDNDNLIYYGYGPIERWRTTSTGTTWTGSGTFGGTLSALGSATITSGSNSLLNLTNSTASNTWSLNSYLDGTFYLGSSTLFNVMVANPTTGAVNFIGSGTFGGDLITTGDNLSVISSSGTSTLNLVSPGNYSWRVRGHSDRMAFYRDNTEIGNFDVSGALNIGALSVSGLVKIEGPQNGWQHKGTVANQALYEEWVSSSGVRRGFMGYGSGSTNNFSIFNEHSDGEIHLATNSIVALTIASNQAITAASDFTAETLTSESNITINSGYGLYFWNPSNTNFTALFANSPAGYVLNLPAKNGTLATTNDITNASRVKQLEEWRTDSANVGSTLTYVYNYNIPAGTLSSDGDKLDFTFSGTYTGNGNSKQARIDIGGLGILFPAVTTSGGFWSISGTAIRTGSSGVRVSYTKTDHNGLQTVATSDGSATWSSPVQFKLSLDGDASGDLTAKLGSITYTPTP